MNSTARATLLHLRPRSWPIVFSHYCAGALVVMAHMQTGYTAAAVTAVLGGILWAVFLNGGTLAINSAYDTDSGSIGYLDNPPPVPRHLALTALVLMTAGGVIAFAVLSKTYFAAYLASFVLSLLYSVPPVRLKAVPGPDLLINMAGYGFLTFAAGGLAVSYPGGVENPVQQVLLILAASFGLLFGAFYPMTQIYQIESDRANGDRTLAVILGETKSLGLSLLLIGLAATCQIYAALLARMSGPGLALILVVNGAWVLFAADWLLRVKTYPAHAGMYRALKLWALSDVSVVVAHWAFGGL